MRVARLLWLFLLMLTVWSGMMAWEASSYMARPCQERGVPGYWGCLLESPIAELELAESPAGFKARIDQGSPGQYETWNVAIARVNTCMDFLLIGLYWAVFVLFAVEGGGRLCRTLIGVISLTAILDVIENVRLLQALRAIGNGAAFSFTPRDLSLGKWIFFALAAVLLANLLKRGPGRWRLVATVLLIATAAVTIAGLFWVPLLTASSGLLLAVLLIALVLYVPLHPWDWKTVLTWVEFGYLIRFQVIGGVLLAILLPAGFFAAPSIFAGIFDAQSFLSFVFVVYVAQQLALIVMITSRLALVYGPERFAGIETLPVASQATWGMTAMFSLLACPVIAMTCCGTEIPGWQKAIGMLAATALSVAGLWLIAKLHFYIEASPGYTARMIFPGFPLLRTARQPRWSSGGWLHRQLARLLPERLSRGVLRSELESDLEGEGTVGSLLSGHQLATAAVLVQALSYVVIGLLSAPVTGSHTQRGMVSAADTAERATACSAVLPVVPIGIVYLVLFGGCLHSRYRPDTGGDDQPGDLVGLRTAGHGPYLRGVSRGRSCSAAFAGGSGSRVGAEEGQRGRPDGDCGHVGRRDSRGCMDGRGVDRPDPGVRGYAGGEPVRLLAGAGERRFRWQRRRDVFRGIVCA